MWVKNLVTPSLARKRWLAPTKSQPGYFNWINKLIWLIQHVDWLNILIDSVWWLTQLLYWLRMMIDTAWWLTHHVDWHRMLIYTACWRNQHVAWPSMLSQSACKVNQQGGFVVCMYSTVPVRLANVTVVVGASRRGVSWWTDMSWNYLGTYF